MGHLWLSLWMVLKVVGRDDNVSLCMFLSSLFMILLLITSVALIWIISTSKCCWYFSSCYHKKFEVLVFLDCWKIFLYNFRRIIKTSLKYSIAAILSIYAFFGTLMCISRDFRNAVLFLHIGKNFQGKFWSRITFKIILALGLVQESLFMLLFPSSSWHSLISEQGRPFWGKFWHIYCIAFLPS